MKKALAILAIFVLVFSTGNVLAQDACGPQLNVTNASCGFNGAINTTFPNQGVQQGYSFAWSGPNNFSANTQNISNLNTGTYTLVVTYLWNGSGCQSTNTATVGFTPSPININTIATAVSCNGGYNGSVNIDVWGGTPLYSYSWSNGAHTEDIQNLTPGNYTVTVTDAAGCTNFGFASVGQPAPLQTTIATNNGSCGNTASAVATTIGGTAPYTYHWSTGANTQSISNLATGSYTVTTTDAHNCTQTASTFVTGGGAGINPTVTGTCDGATITGLAPGTYTVTITNADGCTKTSTFTVACNLTVAPSVNNVSCNGGNNGNINLNVTGGTVPYGFHWNTGSSAQNLNNLPAGTYSVTVTDATGATKTTSATVNQPSAIFVSSNVTNVNTNGGNNGAINLTVNGGTPGYVFHWNTGAMQEDIFNLTAGTYTAIITDAAGCNTNISATVTQPAPCTAPDAQFNLPQSGGLTLQFSNTSTGSGPLTYEWWFGDGGTSTDFNPTHTYPFPGVYLVTLRVTNPCGQELIQKTLTVLNGPTPAQEPGGGEFNFVVGPNPTTDKVFVKAPTGEYEVFLVNTKGQILREVIANGNFQIPMSDLPPGIYFLEVFTQGKLIKSFPIVKQ